MRGAKTNWRLYVKMMLFRWPRSMMSSDRYTLNGPVLTRKLRITWLWLETEPTLPTSCFVTIPMASPMEIPTKRPSSARRPALLLPESWFTIARKSGSRRRCSTCGSQSFSSSSVQTFSPQTSSSRWSTGFAKQAPWSSPSPPPPRHLQLARLFDSPLLSLIQFDSKRGPLSVYHYLFVPTSFKWILNEFHDVFYSSSFILFICVSGPVVQLTDEAHTRSIMNGNLRIKHDRGRCNDIGMISRGSLNKSSLFRYFIL